MKNTKYKILIKLTSLFVFLFVGVGSALAGSWTNVGNAGFTAGSAELVSFNLDSNDTPYIVYRDNVSFKATVMKYDGSSWGLVGSAGFSPDYILTPSINFDSNNIPYVAYQDGANSDKATVMKYDGSSWVVVGSAGFTSGSVQYLTSDIDSNDIPYVAYKDNTGKATVMKYNGSSWVVVGSAGFSASTLDFIKIKISSNNIPYVVFRDTATGDKITVMKYNGSSWELVGSAGFSSGTVYYVSIAIDTNNIPYVVYRDDANSYYSTVMKYNGSSWELVGSAGFSGYEVSGVGLGFDSNNKLYAFLNDNMFEYDSSTWVNRGSIGATGVNNAVGSNNIPYVAYQDSANNYKATVKKYIASSEKVITNFTILGDGTVTEGDHTIGVTVPYGTNLTSLTPTIAISSSSTVSPLSGVAQDFTNPLVYTVTAEDGSTQSYTVTVSVTPISNAKSITDFSIGNRVGVVNEGDYTVSLLVRNGTNVTSLIPSISISDFATISPLSDVAQDFTNPVVYTVTAQNSSTQNYTVTVSVDTSHTISSCAEFEAIGTNIGTLEGVYSLTTNLDCTSEGNDIMVAVNGDPFMGSFDGNGYTITVDIETVDSNSGLFGQVNGATITDLNIAGSIIGVGNLGALIGRVYNVSDGSTHPILTITNVHSTATVTGSDGYVGGLIGEIYNQGVGEVGDTTAINISNSSVTGNVSGTYYVGGLIGYIDQETSSSISIIDSYVVGDITGTDNEVGGLVGEWDHYDGDVVLTGSHYSGNITSTSGYVGGLVGYMYSDVGGGYEESTFTISNNYTTGSVSGNDSVGGLLGYVEAYLDQEFPLTINIENNYSTANVAVTGSDDAGGLIGYFYVDNYYTDYALNINLNENYAESTITVGGDYSEAGGLIGRLQVGSNNTFVTLSKSYFSGSITSAGFYIAGLVGNVQNSGDKDITISDSYASADIVALGSSGGLVGYAYSTGGDLNINRSYAVGTVTGTDADNSTEGGGLIGVINGGVNITDSFAAVDISTFTSGYGAIIGFLNNSFTATNVFFDQTTSGGIECADNGVNEGCTPVNTTESSNTTYFKSNHTNAPMDEWNFSTIWRNKSGINNNYPVLQAFTVADAVSTPVVVSSGGAVPVYILQAMSDTLRIKENQTNNTQNYNNQTNTNTSNSNNTIIKFTFTKNLKYKDNNTDVKELQKFLNTNGFTIATKGPGSINKETNYFGPATRNALVKYQIANNIKPAVGYFGPLTRSLVNK